MKNLLFLLIISISTLSACRCNKGKSDTVVKTDSLHTVHNIVEEDSTMLYDAGLNTWIGASLQKSNWQWSNFSLIEFWATDSTEKKNHTVPPNFYKQYGSVLRWSIDSSYILDIGSYGSVIIKTAHGVHLEKGEPDTEIALLYPKEHKKMRVLFSGPSTHIINAAWLDSTQVAMLGVIENQTGSADTLLWIIDAKQDFFRQYKWNKSK